MDVLIIPLVALAVPIIIVPTALGIKHARYLREVEHAETMRAMDLGQLPVDPHSWTPVGIAGGIGIGVPLGAMFLAFIAASKGGSADTLWIAAGMIGVAGVICGSILTALQMAKAGKPSPVPTEKPVYDPDQFDVVGSRG